MFKIEPIYLIFAFSLLILSRFKKNKVTAVVSAVFFLLLFSFSKNGSDYYNYQTLYYSIASGESLFVVHGEIGYNILVKLATSIHMPYHTFRMILLLICSTVLFIYVYKLSPNFHLSFFALFCMFLIFTISAYRQFIVMCFSFPIMYSYIKSNKKFRYILFAALLILFHKSAVIVVFLLAVDYILFKMHANQLVNNVFKSVFLLTIIALVIRVIWFYASNIVFFNTIINIIFSEADMRLINVGLISRLSFMVCLVFVYNKSKKDKLIDTILLFYMIGILIYIALPYEYEMGRLMNNANIYGIVLIPLIYHNYSNTLIPLNRSKQVLIQKKQVIQIWYMCFIILVCLAILINQLLNQGGYSPYTNPFLNFGGLL